METQQTPGTNQQIDPTALNLSRAIRMAETNKDGDYNASVKEPNGTISHGAYGFNGDNFQKWATQFGLNPSDMSQTNQDHVAYSRIKDLLDKGHAQSEVAAIWNGATVDKSGKYIPINPDYVKKVKNNYIQITKGFNPEPYSNPSIDTSGKPNSSLMDIGTANAAENGQKLVPEQNIWQKAGDVAKGVGNFLFPIVGDVYHDFKGDSKKSFLQQTGDFALSALPFIPGLGEAGEAVRGGEAAIEGGGLIAKLLGSTVAKGAAVGYGAGVAGNLSQGKGVGESLMPGLNTVGGAVLGGAAPIALKGISKGIGMLSGISPQIENELSRLGSQRAPEDLGLYNEYINAAKEHATNVRARAPLTLAADNLDEAAGQISKQTEAAGQAIGAAKKASAEIPIDRAEIQQVADEYRQHVTDKYGLDLVSNKKGVVTANSVPGRARQVNPGDLRRIEDMATQLNQLGKSATVGKSADVIANLNELVSFENADVYGKTNDPLEALIKATAGDVNGVIRKNAPELAGANDVFSGLKDLQGEIKTMAGGNLNRGELMMKRVFSGDKSGDVLDFFQKIKDATGIDLVKHAVLAKHAVETVGSKADKTLLQQAIGGEIGERAGLLGSALNLGKTTLKKTIANPEARGRSLISGKSGLLPSLLNRGGTKASIEASRFLSK